MARPETCPCGRSKPYALCCGVFHRGALEAPDAESLMRSRYCGFAKVEPAYLWRTLHASHRDRSRPEKTVLSELRQGAESHRYLGLTVRAVEVSGDGGSARVLFHARVFQKGRDLSFAEVSEFLHDGVGWRYVRGRAKPMRDAGGIAETTIEEFWGALSDRKDLEVG